MARGPGPARFHLKWEERNGPEVMPPTRQGFGNIVLQRMTAATLQGKVDHKFDPHGVSWSLEAPAAAVMAREPREGARELRFAMRNHAVIGGVQAIAH